MRDSNFESIKDALNMIQEGKYYIVSGEIFNKKGLKIGFVNKRGYIVCRIKRKQIYLHRLIFAYHYGIEELEKYETINHIDGNKENNDINNLEGMSRSENLKHAWENGLNKVGKNARHTKLTEEQVKEIRQLIKEGYIAKDLAKMYNVSVSQIYNIRQNLAWKAVK